MTYKTEVQLHISRLISNRRHMIRKGLSNRNEIDMTLKLNNLEYWTSLLCTDKQAARFVVSRYEYIKGILPFKQGHLTHEGIEALQSLRIKAHQFLQPQQLEFF